MSTVRIRTDQDAVLNAAEWLRQDLAVPDYEIIEPQFEQHFDCRIVRAPPDDFVFGEVYAEFDEQTAALFVLRWS
jgi:hypothetical protein